jgi:predicted glycosyltransferase
VKVHPAENPNWYYKHCLDEADGRVRIVPHDEVELHPLLRASDVMLTYSSTTNLEAMLLGLPVITVAINSQLAKEERVIRLEDYGLPLVTEEEELTQILKTLMKNDNALGKIIANAGKKALDYLMVNHLDGSATERVVALITKQINI